jgi:hypothetical protein
MLNAAKAQSGFPARNAQSSREIVHRRRARYQSELVNAHPWEHSQLNKTVKWCLLT